jgi:hypothetical protein
LASSSSTPELSARQNDSIGEGSFDGPARGSNTFSLVPLGFELLFADSLSARPRVLRVDMKTGVVARDDEEEEEEEEEEEKCSSSIRDDLARSGFLLLFCKGLIAVHAFLVHVPSISRRLVPPSVEHHHHVHARPFRQRPYSAHSSPSVRGDDSGAHPGRF